MIPRISTVKLSAKNFVYDGKAKKPGVTVSDRTGHKLVNNKEYTVTYASGRKNVGTYKVTVKFKGKYSGSKALSFIINPKSPVLTGFEEKSNGIKVTWKKMTAQVTGFQIQIASNTKFTKNKVQATVSDNKKTSKLIKCSNPDKIRTCRIRAYKVVNGKKYYSEWG